MLYQLMREVKTLRDRRDAQRQNQALPSPRSGPSKDDVTGVLEPDERGPAVQGER